MMGHDLIRPDPVRHGALRMTDAALPILRDEAKITLRRDTIKAAGSASRRPAVKAYIIFTDRTLIEMAETRPANLDQMAGVSGIGAKKLESYGAAFLEVINGEAEVMHPQRRKLAGRGAGDVYDQLLEVQAELSRGALGTDKPLSCSASLLAKVAQMRGADEAAMERLLGDKRAERFGAAFLDVLRAAD